MADSTIIKVSSKTSPRGEMGQKHLALGKGIAMRMWENEEPGGSQADTTREYETVGYVVKGRAKLHLEGQTVLLEPGDSWIVARGAKHHYEVLETFTAIEATTPPAEVKGRDAAS